MHGARVKCCSQEGCVNGAIKGGVWVMHGARVRRCSHEGCVSAAKRVAFALRMARG